MVSFENTVHFCTTKGFLVPRKLGGEFKTLNGFFGTLHRYRVTFLQFHFLIIDRDNCWTYFWYKTIIIIRKYLE